MKKLAAVLLSCALGCSLCACTSSEPQSPTETQTVGTYAGEVNPASYPNTISSSFVADHLYGNDIDTLREHSDEVVEGTIEKLSYITNDSIAFTIADVKVMSSLSDKGAVKDGDHINIIFSGGYIPLADVLSVGDSLSKAYADWPQEKIDSTVVFQACMDERAPEVGDHAVFFLMKEKGFPKWGNLYAVISGANGELLSNDEDAEAFEYNQLGEKPEEYSVEAIETAFNNDEMSFEKAAQEVEPAES